MLTAFSLFLTLYVLVRVLWRAPLALPLRLLLAVLTAAGACKLLLFRFVFGSYSPELPSWFQVGAGIPLGLVLLFAALSLGRDVLLLLCLLAERCGLGHAWTWLRARDAGISLELALLAVVLVGAGITAALRVPAVREVEIAVRHLPPELDGMRLAHLSDLHLSQTFSRPWAEALVARVNAARPDIILLTAGNHEYYSSYPAWQPVLGRLGIRMLDNAFALLPYRGSHLLLLGVTDQAAAHFGLPGPDTEGTLRRALAASARAWPSRITGQRPDAREGTPPVLLLAHRPALFSKLRGRIRLQLSGHTHGGSLLGVDWLVARFNDGYVRGLYGDADSRLVVSSGCGLWSGFPFRLGVPGEILLLVLRPAPEEEGLPSARPLP